MSLAYSLYVFYTQNCLDSFPWELNSCEKCKWPRHLHKKFTYNSSKVQDQNILVSYNKGKKSEHCWQAQESRRGHGNWGCHRLLQATNSHRHSKWHMAANFSVVAAGAQTGASHRGSKSLFRAAASCTHTEKSFPYPTSYWGRHGERPG